MSWEWHSITRGLRLQNEQKRFIHCDVKMHIVSNLSKWFFILHTHHFIALNEDIMYIQYQLPHEKGGFIVGIGV